MLLCLFLGSLAVSAQEVRLERIEPPNWWTGFKNKNLQLLVYGKNIAGTTPAIVSGQRNPPVLKAVHKVANPNYLFLDLLFSDQTEAGFLDITFTLNGAEVASYNWEIRQRESGSDMRKGFSAADVIYLITPDRFANGDTTNDNAGVPRELVNRSNKDGRHGGDIKGIAGKLDYLKDLGVTALWITPMVENNQPTYSYHGYSATDYYKTDPRFGTNEDYFNLGVQLHIRGMKLIQDQVFNHCGSYHWWMADLPSPDWINQWSEFTRSTYRAGSVTDPYVSIRDRELFVRGWFDKTMPDLNQNNPFLKTYLIQNSIWWIELAGLDGIRQDTHPYPFKEMMAEWGAAVLTEYPHFNIVGECWMNYPATVAYWQKDACNLDGYNSNMPALFDFPTYDALSRAFREKEGWNTGIVRLYEILAQDFSYPNPLNLVTFADNHDVNRYLDTQEDDLRRFRMAMTFLLTTRGIPQIFYGSEVLLTTGEDEGHGNLRKDFPGGWPTDSRNAFTEQGRTPDENNMFNYFRTLLNYRKNHPVLQTGKLTQFIPENGIFVYFRHNERSCVMVVMNNNQEEKAISTARYSELLPAGVKGYDIFSAQTLPDMNLLTIAGKSALVLEIRK